MQTYRMEGVLYFAFLMVVISEDTEKMDAGECQTGWSVFLSERLIISLVCLA